MQSRIIGNHFRSVPVGCSPQNNLAWLLSTHPDSELRNGEEAIKLITPIIKADGGNNHTTLSTLAAALAETGDFKGAIETTTRALHYAQAVGANDASLRAALINYRNGKSLSCQIISFP